MQSGPAPPASLRGGPATALWQLPAGPPTSSCTIRTVGAPLRHTQHTLTVGQVAVQVDAVAAAQGLGLLALAGGEELPATAGGRGGAACRDEWCPCRTVGKQAARSAVVAGPHLVLAIASTDRRRRTQRVARMTAVTVLQQGKGGRTLVVARLEEAVGGTANRYRGYRWCTACSPRLGLHAHRRAYLKALVGGGRTCRRNRIPESREWRRRAGRGLL